MPCSEGVWPALTWSCARPSRTSRATWDREPRSVSILAYLCLEDSASVPHTLDRARAHVGEARVVVGFPDIVFGPDDALAELVRRQEHEHADVVLGLAPADRPDKCDLVRRDAGGRIRGFVVKRARARLPETWVLAVWTSAFTRFLHTWVRTGRGQSGRVSDGRRLREAALSDVFTDAIAAGLVVVGHPLADAWYIDIGTPEDLARAIATLDGRGRAVEGARGMPSRR